MWKFRPSTDFDGLGRSSPLLRSVNKHCGRQVWCWEENAGTPDEREAVEKARQVFTENRQHQKHAADELLRWVLAWAPDRRSRLPRCRPSLLTMPCALQITASMVAGRPVC